MTHKRIAQILLHNLLNVAGYDKETLADPRTGEAHCIATVIGLINPMETKKLGRGLSEMRKSCSQLLSLRALKAIDEEIRRIESYETKPPIKVSIRLGNTNSPDKIFRFSVWGFLTTGDVIKVRYSECGDMIPIAVYNTASEDWKLEADFINKFKISFHCVSDFTVSEGEL